MPSAPPLPPPPPGNSLNGVPIPPAEAAPAPDGGAVPAAPSAFGPNANGGPSVAIAHYDQNGRYVTPQGTMEQQTNLIAGGTSPKTWQDLMPT